MKIWIEARPLIQSEKTGISQYIYLLYRELFNDSAEDCFVVWALNLKDDPFAPSKNKIFYGKRNPHIPRAILELLWKFVPFRAVDTDADIYHLPYAAIPALRRGKNTRLVVNIYDLAFRQYPEFTSNTSYVRSLHQSIPRQIAESDKIITISEHTKKDLQKFYNVSDDKIAVIYPGTDLTAPSEIPLALTELCLPERYILSVGTLEPRKNLILLFRAAYLLRRKLRESNIKICLAGATGWKHDATERVLDELQIQDLVIKLGYVPREVLPALYAGATAFVYPSLYEGFGLPVLEALACGAPVVTSNVSSLPEVGGDAALYIDPHSIEELAAAIEKLLDDEALREQLKIKGFAQAAKFSWEKCARETLAVYHEIAGE